MQKKSEKNFLRKVDPKQLKTFRKNRFSDFKGPRTHFSKNDPKSALEAVFWPYFAQKGRKMVVFGVKCVQNEFFFENVFFWKVKFGSKKTSQKNNFLKFFQFAHI